MYNTLLSKILLDHSLCYLYTHVHQTLNIRCLWVRLLSLMHDVTVVNHAHHWKFHQVLHARICLVLLLYHNISCNACMEARLLSVDRDCITRSSLHGVYLFTMSKVYSFLAWHMWKVHCNCPWPTASLIHNVIYMSACVEAWTLLTGELMHACTQ